MPKFALVVKKDFNPYSITPDELIQKQSYLVDREICETDRNTLQIIPYIALVDGSVSATDPKYFVYTRGAAGAEGRLVGKCSIGLGGHIEEAPEGSVNLCRVIAECAVRELEEEVGLSLPFTDFANAMYPNSYMPSTAEENVLMVPSSLILFHEITEVDAVHMAVCFAVKAKPSDLTSAEEGVITRGAWMTYSEIAAACEKEVDPMVLETWSKGLLVYLNHMISPPVETSAEVEELAI